MPTESDDSPYAYIERHYREPRTDDPIERWLPHPQVARGVCGALEAFGCRLGDLEDRLQHVYAEALTSFRLADPPTRPPADLRGMRAYCRAIARYEMISSQRKGRKGKKKHGPVVVGLCESPDAFTPLEYGAERPDPVDARRQLEAVEQLFREGGMPEHGADILQGVARGYTHPEIATELGITVHTVEGRVRRMRGRCRKRMVKLGMLPGKRRKSAGRAKKS